MQLKDPLVIDDQSALLAEACRPVANDISSLGTFLVQHLLDQTQSRTAHGVIQHVFGAKGKRVRPILFFMACDMVGYAGQHRLPIGAVSEYVHTASLLHDDVVDSSTMRRNKPTSNSIWGDEAAVLVGDLIYSTASRLMAQSNKLEIVDGFADAITRMSEGELLQLEAIGNLDLAEAGYLKILGGKTGALIGTACRSAGILAGISADKQQALYDFGFYTGMAFQIVDDVLDYTSDISVAGKAPMSDLVEGKITLPLIAVRPSLTPDERSSFEQALKGGLVDSQIAVRLAQVVRERQGTVVSLDLARSYTRRAMDALTLHFPRSDARSRLENVVGALLHRVS